MLLFRKGEINHTPADSIRGGGVGPDKVVVSNIAEVLSDNMTEEDKKNQKTFLSAIENSEIRKEWEDFFSKQVEYGKDYISVCGEKIARTGKDTELRSKGDIDFGKIPDFGKILEQMPGFGGRPSIGELNTYQIKEKFSIQNMDEFNQNYSSSKMTKQEFFICILGFGFHSCRPFFGGGQNVKQGFYWNNSGRDNGHGKGLFLHLHSGEGVCIGDEMGYGSSYSAREKG